MRDFTALMQYYGETSEIGLALAGGVTYLISLFGADPYSWVLENSEWIPAYYSEKMVAGLQFARGLYESGCLDKNYTLTKANNAVEQFTGRKAGALIRHGDAYWLMRVLNEFAETNGITAPEASEWYVGMLPPPNGFWPRSVETGGCVVSAAVDDTKLDAILKFLDFSLSGKGEELAYFGLLGETCAPDINGELRLFVNPTTALPFNIVLEYPSARALFLLAPTQDRLAEYDANIPSKMPPDIKAAFNEAERLYAEAAVDEGDGFIIRFMHTPALEQLASEINFASVFNDIVTGTEPVTEMFARFRRECEQKNIRTAIGEVNARMKALF
jgi:putative aldouronate transport system substrate-binding protein